LYFGWGFPDFQTGKSAPCSAGEFTNPPSDEMMVGPRCKIPFVSRLVPGGIRGFSTTGPYVEGMGEVSRGSFMVSRNAFGSVITYWFFDLFLHHFIIKLVKGIKKTILKIFIKCLMLNYFCKNNFALC